MTIMTRLKQQKKMSKNRTQRTNMGQLLERGDLNSKVFRISVNSKLPRDLMLNVKNIFYSNYFNSTNYQESYFIIPGYSAYYELRTLFLSGYFVPSDFILLGKNAPSPIFGNFNDIKLRKTALKESQFANPPLGGVMSNYVLLRNRPNYQSFIPFAAEEEESSATVPKELPVSKRQVSDSTDTDDTVVINAENTHSVKMNEEESRDQMTDDEDGEDEDQPAVAQVDHILRFAL